MYQALGYSGEKDIHEVGGLCTGTAPFHTL